LNPFANQQLSLLAALGLRLKEDRGSSRFQQPIRRDIAVKGTAMNVSRQK
jgi:hypothetical protein